jgi:hypothetical protein
MLGKKHPEVGPKVEEYQRISGSQRRRLLADYWEKQRRDVAWPWTMPGMKGGRKASGRWQRRTR